MTSRPATIPQRIATGASLQRPVPHPRPVALHPSPTGTARPPDAVVDLTSDESKAAARDGSQKARPAKPGAPAEDTSKLVLDTQVAMPDVAARLSARGKPQVLFEGTMTPGGVSETAKPPPASTPGQRGMATTATGALPMPPRPGFHQQDRSSKPERKAADEVGTTNKATITRVGGQLDTPPEAVRLARGRTVDFFPWNGNHPEDVFTSEIVQKGWFDDRSKSNQDPPSARQSVGPQMRNKAALASLSNLFVQVLDKRQQSGRLTAPSTFKPPPRVTITDTKREEWLRDLADPTIPLRRLNKRIPHGIRGKLLLEQCLGKKIPPTRAVWLAKCVGTNEMRAFKRKGAGSTTGPSAEHKWIREWTIFVEQFVESTIGQCGQSDWKTKMDYVIRLSSHLYSEKLLDQDHYLDWLLTSLESSDMERLPVLLVLIQIYWQELVSIRKRGRRLSEALLAHLDAMESATNIEAEFPPLVRMRKLVTSLIVRHRSCMIALRSWRKCRHVVDRLYEESEDPILDSAIENIIRRNKRLVDWAEDRENTGHSPRKDVLSALDSVKLDLNVEKLSSKCSMAIPDSHDLVLTVLQWACSVYREGHHRLYIATRLLRKWKNKGMDIDSPILSILTDSQRLKGIRQRDLFRVVAELVRSKHFSVGRYLQWLIASGSLSYGSSTKSDACHLRLIAEIPLHGLPEHVLNLRQTLLRGAMQNKHPGAADLLDDQNGVREEIMQLFDSPAQAELASSAPIWSLNTNSRLEISRWIRQELNDKMFDDESEATSDQDAMDEDFVLRPYLFNAIRHILEEMDDYAILADVLNIATESDDSYVLAAIADTLSYHVRTFAAIGALKSLFQRLVERYGKLRNEKPLERPFFLSLADLCCRLQADPQIVHQLTFDLSRLEQKASLVACSPASDNMADFQAAKLEFDDEIDRILNSGTSMDENMVARVFARVVTRLEELLGATPDQNSKFGQWFDRLKSFDEKCFERLMSDCVSGMLVSPHVEMLCHTLPSAVGSGCFSLESFMTCSQQTVGFLRRSNVGAAATASLRILDAMLPFKDTKSFGQIQEVYRYKLEQERYCQDRQAAVLDLVRQTIDLCSDKVDASIAARFGDLLRSERLLRVLRLYASQGAQEFCTAFGINPSQDAPQMPAAWEERRTSNIRIVFDALLDPFNTLGLSKLDPDDQATIVVDFADEFSIPFCQLELQLLFKIHSASDEEGEVGVADTVIQAVKDAVDNNKPIWSDLLMGLDGEMTRKIREYAESHILSAVADYSKGRTSVQDPESKEKDEEVLQRYVSVLNLTASSIEDQGQVQIVGQLADRLRGLLEIGGRDERQTAVAGTICPWIEALLHLIVVHKSSLQNGKMTANQQAGLLWVLRSCLLWPSLQQYNNTVEYMFDVAASLSDGLTDELRSQLHRMESSKATHDPRVSFLLGAASSPDGWLGLSTPLPNTQSASTPRMGAQHQQAGFWQAQKQAQPILPQPPPLQIQRTNTNTDTHSYAKPTPFPLKRWEILPDSGSAGGNDTALSLTLFGAKKV